MNDNDKLVLLTEDVNLNMLGFCEVDMLKGRGIEIKYEDMVIVGVSYGNAFLEARGIV